MGEGLPTKGVYNMLEFILDNTWWIFVAIVIGLIPSHVQQKTIESKQAKNDSLFSKLNRPLE